jgi:hypothetical protein
MQGKISLLQVDDGFESHVAHRPNNKKSKNIKLMTIQLSATLLVSAGVLVKLSV